MMCIISLYLVIIPWQDHVRNPDDVSSLTGLGPVLGPVVRRRSSLFGHLFMLLLFVLF